MTSLSTCSDNTSTLTISEPFKDEVSDTYKQFIKRDGQRVLISTPEIFQPTGLYFKQNGKMSSVLVPLDDTTRNAFKEVESEVLTNIQTEKHKPLYLQDSMFVPMSHWCLVNQVNKDGSHSPIQPGVLLGKGHYSLLIHISHVYFGKLKAGETSCLSLSVIQILYRPESDIMELIECLSASPVDGVTPSSDLQKKAAPKKRGRSKKEKANDIPQTLIPSTSALTSSN